MGVHTVSRTIRMEGETQVDNITTAVADAVAVSSFKAGIVTVFVKHTTASVMIIEDEPGIRADTKTFW
ncbi:MAG: YjbQ family protein, partial [Nitrospira sp.]